MGSTQPREYNWGATRKKSSGSGLESREYGRRDPSCWPRGTLYPRRLALILPTSGGRSVGIVRSRTQAMKFSLVVIKTSNFWAIICCSPLKLNRHFRGTCRLHLRGLKMSQWRHRNESDGKQNALMPVSCLPYPLTLKTETCSSGAWTEMQWTMQLHISKDRLACRDHFPPA
jgi:hypothetical protein